MCQAILYPICRLLGRPRYRGMEHINVPGPLLIVGNHISHIDPIYSTVFIRKAGRVPHVLAKASLWKIPVVGRVLRGTEQIPVERGGGQGQAALSAAIESLTEGKAVLIYPDGTVTKDPDMWPMRPRPGVAALALSGDWTVVPMVHWGTQQVYRSYIGKGRFKPLPRKDIHVVAGPAIDLSGYRTGEAPDARAIRDVSYLLQGAVRDLLAQVRGEQPPTTFFDPKKAERAAAAAEADRAPQTGANS